MNFKIIPIADIDTTSFNWHYKRAALPLPAFAAGFKDKVYQISGFNGKHNEYVFTLCESVEEIIELSISLHRDITFPEVAKIACIAASFNINPCRLSIFRKQNIKGDKNIQTLLKTALLPEEILDYIAVKEIPLKTIALLTTFTPKAINFVKDRLIIDREPTAAEFINFINLTADFKDIAESCPYSQNFAFPERISPERQFAQAQLWELNSYIAPVTVKAKDFFEKGQAEFSFKASSYEEFNEICRKLTENLKNVQDFFNKMKSHDIC